MNKEKLCRNTEHTYITKGRNEESTPKGILRGRLNGRSSEVHMGYTKDIVIGTREKLVIIPKKKIKKPVKSLKDADGKD